MKKNAEGYNILYGYSRVKVIESWQIGLLYRGSFGFGVIVAVSRDIGIRC